MMFSLFRQAHVFGGGAGEEDNIAYLVISSFTGLLAFICPSCCTVSLLCFSNTKNCCFFLLFNEKLKLAYILRKTFLTLLIKMMTFTLWLSFSFSFHFRLLFSIHSLPSPNSFFFILVSLSKFHLFSYLRSICLVPSLDISLLFLLRVFSPLSISSPLDFWIIFLFPFFSFFVVVIIFSSSSSSSCFGFILLYHPPPPTVQTIWHSTNI